VILAENLEDTTVADLQARWETVSNPENEPFGRNWTWDYYAYWNEMRGSPPRGQTWGNSFVGGSCHATT
jgi:hypothetical protein